MRAFVILGLLYALHNYLGEIDGMMALAGKVSRGEIRQPGAHKMFYRFRSNLQT